MDIDLVPWATRRFRSATVEEDPHKFFVLDELLPREFLTPLHSEISLLRQSFEPTHVMESIHGLKRESRAAPKQLPILHSLFSYLSSEMLASSLKTIFGWAGDLRGDSSFDGGGLVISPPGASLTSHADFNWSSEVNAYRVINLLLYLNPHYAADDGGCLILLDPDGHSVRQRIAPTWGRCAAFVTTDRTPHGVEPNGSEFERISFNTYFYSDSPPDETAQVPHKTIWLNGNSEEDGDGYVD